MYSNLFNRNYFVFWCWLLIQLEPEHRNNVPMSFNLLSKIPMINHSFILLDGLRCVGAKILVTTPIPLGNILWHDQNFMTKIMKHSTVSGESISRTCLPNDFKRNHSTRIKRKSFQWANGGTKKQLPRLFGKLNYHPFSIKVFQFYQWWIKLWAKRKFSVLQFLFPRKKWVNIIIALQQIVRVCFITI